MQLPVFLDNHSTTRVDDRVAAGMVRSMTEEYGNAASRQHEFGWRAEATVEIARKRVAALVGADEKEIVFTSGATESINLALKGLAEAGGRTGDRIVTAATEHKAGLEVADILRRQGYDVVVLPVDRTGLVDPDDVRKALEKKTLLVSIMAANNEIGTIAPLRAIGGICRERGVLFHTDAAQAAGKVPVDVRAMNIDILSMSAHKLHGPKGAGALFIRASRPAIRMAPQIIGGGHENGYRSGTLNVPGIAGFGEAARIALAEGEEDARRIGLLRDRLVEGLSRRIDGLKVNGHPTDRLACNANVLIPGVQSGRLIMAMKDVCISAGSACSSASPEPSHVLRAIGLDAHEAACCVRFGLSKYTTEEEIDYAVGRVSEAVVTLAGRAVLAS
jgi:cysteine desulfurase